MGIRKLQANKNNPYVVAMGQYLDNATYFRKVVYFNMKLQSTMFATSKKRNSSIIKYDSGYGVIRLIGFSPECGVTLLVQKLNLIQEMGHFSQFRDCDSGEGNPMVIVNIQRVQKAMICIKVGHVLHLCDFVKSQ